MKYFFLIAAFNALFFAVLLFQKKPKALHDKILFFWLIYLGLFNSLYTFSSHEIFSGIKHISSFIISMFLLHGPFLYLYIESLTSGKKRTAKRDQLKRLNGHIERVVREKYNLVSDLHKVKDESPEKGREYVKAYVDYTHTLEAIHDVLEHGGGHAEHKH